MRLWLLYVIGAFLAWGAYVPMLHAGQTALRGGALRGFLCVGLAYFLTAVLIPLGLLYSGVEPWDWNQRGIVFATVAGVLGAAGALCVILALKAGGSPLVVAPLVFAGAPVINSLVSLAWHRPQSAPQPLFYLGIALAAAGAYLVLRFRPS
jgi:uncharacterized membrane protein